MTDRIKVIVNPYSGRWKGQKAIPAVEAALRRAGLDFDLVCTSGPDEGIALAREAAEAGYDIVVAAGGDGTISEVANGLVLAAGDAVAGTLGIIPLGSANDFIHTLGTPADIAAACQRLAAGQTQVIDLARINDRYFINNTGLGFEPQITIESRKIKRLRGRLIYVVAIFRALAHRVQPVMTIEWDEGRVTQEILLVTVGNGRRTGGFWLAPLAELQDGLLDFAFAGGLTLPQILWLLIHVIRKTHLEQKAVTWGRTRRIVIESEAPIPAHADGEIITTGGTHFEAEVLPSRLRVVC